MTDLSGKLLWSRGSTSGIGRATAVALAANGAHVLVGGRDEQRAKDVVACAVFWPVMMPASFRASLLQSMEGG